MKTTMLEPGARKMLEEVRVGTKSIEAAKLLVLCDIACSLSAIRSILEEGLQRT